MLFGVYITVAATTIMGLALSAIATSGQPRSEPQTDALCRDCSQQLTWVPQYSRYYCYKCSKYPPVCQSCGKDLFWRPHENQYYCATCGKPAAPPGERYYTDTIRKAYEDLKAKRESGAVDQPTFDRKMSTLIFQDDSGRTWAIGGKSGKWVYYDGKTWVESDPPTTLIG